MDLSSFVKSREGEKRKDRESKTVEMSGNKWFDIPLCPNENVGACKNDHLRTCGIVCISS